MDLYLNVFDYAVNEKRRKLINEPVNEDLIDKNKFANNSEYVPESVYKRILNEMTQGKWSFIPHSIDMVEDKKPYVRYIGLLIVPGFGVHTGVGTQPLDKKDNQNATAAAKTYAFKNACKEMGLAPNVGDDTWEDDLFEDDVDLEDTDIDFSEDKKPSKEKKKEKSKEKPKPKKPSGIKDRIKEIREAYELDSDDDFIAFIQVWDEDILEIEDMDDDDWKDFLDYVENNKKKFEDF